MNSLLVALRSSAEIIQGCHSTWPMCDHRYTAAKVSISVAQRICRLGPEGAVRVESLRRSAMHQGSSTWQDLSRARILVQMRMRVVRRSEAVVCSSFRT